MTTTSDTRPVYIYALLCPTTDELRYVGKTVDLTSRYNTHCNDKTNTYRGKWIRSLKMHGHKPVMIVLEQSDSDNWIEAESFYIQYFKSIGCRLTNLTNGGEGLTGYVHSAETKHKISKAHKGKVLSTQTRLKMSAARTGTKRSEEYRQRVSERYKGRTYTTQALENMRVGRGKHYLITTPTGETVTVSNLNRYCEEIR